MAFVLRSVSHGADGREIVRSARIEGDRLLLGRDPACDVHLTDLAVALRHASIERSGDRLEVAAEPGLTVAIDGRKRRSGTLPLATGGDVGLGGYLLRFLPTPPDAADIAVELEHAARAPSPLPPDVERRFTLAPVMPGKRGLAWLLFLLVLGACLAWPISSHFERREREQKFARFHADTAWSTGSLSAAHQPLSDRCEACHVKPFEAVRDSSCKSCHAEVHDHAAPFRLARAQPDLNRWQRLQLAVQERFGLPAGRCVDCHTEHEGADRMPVTAQRFCADCHSGLKAKLPDTRLADAGDFGSAHPEFQPAVIAGWSGGRPRFERVSLARRPAERSNLRFPHDLHLSRTGGVAQMGRRLGRDYGFGEALECKDCHVPAAGGARFRPVEMEADCAMCHSLAYGRSDGRLLTLPHGDPAAVAAALRGYQSGHRAAMPPSLFPGARRRPGAAIESRARIQFSRAGGSGEAAVRAAFSRGGACFDCHQVRPPAGGAGYAIDPVAFPDRYLQKGWFDHRPHAPQSCGSCHAAAASGAAQDLLLPDLASCRTCHGGEGSSAPVPSSCAMCHDYHIDEGPPAMRLRAAAAGRKRDGAAAERGR